jgi:PAS domain-containing protein
MSTTPLPTLSPAQSTRSPSESAAVCTPTHEHFWPTAICLATLSAFSMGMLNWSHQGWHRLHQQAHEFNAHLAIVRMETQRAEWLIGHATLPQAKDLIQPLAHSHAILVKLQLETPELVRVPLAQLQGDVRATLRQAESIPVNRMALKGALAKVEQSLTVTGTHWDVALQQATDGQQQLDRINIAVVGCVTILLLVLMRRTHRHREQANIQLKAREAQLHAFADALPDLGFRMSSTGHFLDIYGNNLPLLGRPAHGLIAHHLSELFPDDMAQRFLNTLRQALLTRHVQSLTFSVPIQQDLRHFDSRCVPVGDADQVVWMIWVSQQGARPNAD